MFKKKVSCLVLSLLCLCLLPACGSDEDASTQQENRAENISSIYIYHSAHSTKYPEYYIDCQNLHFWQYIPEINATELNRNIDAENCGFSFVSIVESGMQWGITLTFLNDDTLSYYGSNAYPKTWDNMATAFFDLLGTSIL